MAASQPVKRFPVSWEELHRHSKALAWRLVEQGPWKGILTVTRGGLVPAAIIARELGIRLVDTVCVSIYDETNLRDARILKPFTDEDGGRGWLVVDDLVDTGATARVVRDMVPNAHYATVYAKPKGRPLVDTFVTEFSQDTWVDFPWDVELQYSRPISEMTR